MKDVEEKRSQKKTLKLQQKDSYSLLVTAESLIQFQDLDFDSLVLPGQESNLNTQNTTSTLEAIQMLQDACKEATLSTLAQCLVYLAWLHLCQGKYREAKEFLQKVDIQNLQSDELLTNPALFLAYHTTKTITNHYVSKEPIEIISIPKSTGELYWFWYEYLVYACVILISDKDKVQQICTVFLELCPTERLSSKNSLKTIGILRSYLHYLIVKLKSKKEIHPLSGFAHFDLHERIPSTIESIVKQIKLYIQLYERLVVAQCTFPKPESINSKSIEKERYERVLECYDWYVMVEMYGRFLDDGIGDVIDRSYHLLETLYRATTHTFHALGILRYIAHTFLILTQVAGDNMCLDEKREALNAVESYLFHWENEFTLLLDSKVKEKRDQELERDSVLSGGKPSVPTRFLSHRLSGQISQLSSAFGPTLPGIAGSVDGVEPPEGEGRVHFDDIETEARRSVDYRQQVLVVPEVQGETVPDVIGVLITGIRLILLTHEGNLGVLEEAAMMGEKALIILNEHGLLLPNYRSLLCKVHQWLGVVYGELGLETIQREDRSMYQLKGMESFQKAVELENLGMLRYQYALSLVEMGEFDLAMVQVQTAIGLDPAQPMFYNLLALMLDSREQVVKAIEVCKSGWKCCIEHVLQTQVSKNNKVKKQMEFKDIERMINWDVVDPNFKDELFNLKFTGLALEMKNGETSSVIDGLQKTFTLLRRMIGVPPQVNGNPLSEDFRDRRTSLAHSLLNGVTNRSTNSSIPKSMSSSFIPIFHRFKVYEFQIALWLMVSSVYRTMKQPEKSVLAVEEAERMLQLLVVAQDKVRHQTSRLYRERGVDSGVQSNQSVRSVKESVTTKKTIPLYSGGYWKDNDPAISRLQADIALERALIHYEVIKKERVKEPVDKYLKYLSPLARVESERQANQRQQQRHLFQSSTSIDSISISNTLLTDNGSININEDTPTIKMYKIEDEMGMEQVIQKTQLALLFDRYHLPARTFLATVYREMGDIAQSEHHLQLACTANRHRASCSGKSGQTSWFGGTTSLWGWYCWYLLGMTFGEQNRSLEASKATLYALEKRGSCCVRGYECLPRYI